MRSLIKKLVRNLGYDIRLENLSVGTRALALWETDGEFSNIYENIRKRSVGDKQRAFMLWQLARGLRGNIAEVGVYRGGTSALLALCAPESSIYSFDTFGEGMPHTNPEFDLHVRGDFKVDSGEILGYLRRYPNITACPGFFPDSAASVASKSFALIHIDVDIYQSYKDSLEFFYPRMERGGVIVADDYGFTSCPGAKRAWDDFFAGKPEKTIYLPTGQAFVVKG
jgi:O-methyltransferase